MKRYLISSFVLFAFFAFSCKRENCPFPGTKVEGIVIDDSTQKPIEGATIFLQRKKCDRDFMSSSCYCIIIKDVKSDSNGKFKLKFCKSKNHEYNIKATKEGYYPYECYNCGGSCGVHLNDFHSSDGIIRLSQN